jgi:hypothetical protein
VSIIKRLLCKHEYVFERNIYGDEINYAGGNRSWWRCEKCGKRVLDPHLYLELERDSESKTEVDG